MAEIPSYLAPNTPEVPSAALAPVAPSASPAPQLPGTDLSGGSRAQQVFDVENNTVLNIPESELEIAVRSGQYAPQKDKNYYVKDAKNELHSAKGSELRSLLDNGHTIAAPEEYRSLEIQEKYGDSPVLAGVEGTMRGFLPGVSDRALMAIDSNITKEDLAGRAEANPISAMVGEGFGTVFSPHGKLAIGAGAKVASQLAKVGTKAGLSNKIAQAIVAKVIPAAAGSAVEGAYFGAAHLLNEDALGTAQFNAENLLSSVEQGALWGAAFGGGLSALGSATSSTARALAESRAGKYLGNKSDEFIAQATNKNKAVYEFLGITPAKAKKLADRDPEFIEDALKWTREALEENPRAGITEIAAKATADKSSVGSQIGKLYDDVDGTLASKGLPSHTSAKDLKFKIASELDEKIMPKYKGVEGAGAEIKSLNSTINEIFDGATNAEGTLSAKELHKTMRNLDDLIFTEEGALKSRSLKTEIWRLQRDILRSELDTSIATAAKSFPQELSGAADTLKQLNRRYRTISSLEKSVSGRAFGEANSSLLKGAVDMKDLLAISIDPTFGTAAILGKKFLESDTLRKMQILGKIEKAQQATKSAINTGLRAVASGIKSTEPLVSQSLVASAVATELVGGKRTKPKDEQQAYRNIVANAKFATENPEQFLQGVNKYSSHLYAVAPKTSGALDTAALNAMVFLHSKQPKATKNKGFFDAGKVDKVNGADMLKMQQRMDMIQTPSKAFKLLGKGKLGATHVEAIKAVYPSLYSEMQAQTMTFLASQKSTKLNYNQKLNLAMLLDIKSDESMHFTSIMGLQSNFPDVSSESAEGSGSVSASGSAGGVGANGTGIVNSTQSGLAKVDKASRMDNDTSNDDV